MMSDPASAGAAFEIRDEFLDRLEDRVKAFLRPQFTQDGRPMMEARPGGVGRQLVGRPDEALDEDFLRLARDEIGQGYEEIAKATPTMSADDLVERARSDLNAAPARTQLLTQDWQEFDKLLENVSKAADDAGELTGQQAWRIQQNMAEDAARFFDQGGRGYNKGLVRQSISDAIERSLIENADEVLDPNMLEMLRKRYRVLQALSGGQAPAIDQGGLYLGRGYRSMSRAFNELREGRYFDVSPEAGGRELGPVNELFDLFSVGNTLFRNMVGDSGTATRQTIRELQSGSGLAGAALRNLTSRLYYGQPLR